MKRDALLSAVAMCRGAGKLAIGFDAAEIAAKNKAPLVLLASDAAERTRRNMKFCCTPKTKILELGRTRREIEAVVGRSFVVAAVLDENFARLIESNAGGS